MNRRNFVQAAAATPFFSVAYLEAQPTFGKAAVRKLFVYGGEFDRGFTKYAASLTGKANPRICFLPTATGDAPGYVMRWFETCADLPIRPYVQRSFISSYAQKDSFEKVFASMDAILVGGGNTLNMIAIWKAQGIDVALRKAWESGVVLGGGSAGSLCWFEHGTTDSRPGELTKVDGLGFISGSHSPHYDAEAQRRPVYWSKIKSGEYKPGYACDDRAGIYFENESVKQVVSLDEKSNAYHVSVAASGQINERVLPRVVLQP
jgi:dipeptidase E